MARFSVASTVFMVALASCAAPVVTTRHLSPSATSVSKTLSAITTATSELLPPEMPPTNATSEFKTDFSRHTVPYREILSGGPAKDGIPAIDKPEFVSVSEAQEWLNDKEAVVFVRVNDDARAYPIQILTWHEIVNDMVGGKPLAITYCPLCNTAIAFERTFNGQVLDFGTTGRLRYSNLILYDRQTETWWQQGTGTAIAGKYAGEQLTFYPATIISWADFKAAHSNGKVLSRATSFRRNYSENPYVGYDDPKSRPFLYDGPTTPNQLPQLARVIGVELNGEVVAYAYDDLSKVHVINDVIGGEPVVVMWSPGVASSLDAPFVPNGRDVGAANAFSSKLGDRVLTFKRDGERMIDEQTGSTWDLFGEAVDGPLKGQHLTPLVAVNHFWFSWAAFKPGTRVWQP